MRWSPYLGLGALTAAAMLPALFRPPMLQDSFWIDWVWLDQFAHQLSQGDFYPRWLYQSHAGLGSPVFYFYPPLAFFVGAAFVLAGLSTYPALLATFACAFFVSGLGIYLFCRGRTSRPMIAAAVFTLAPYHLLNFYARGALA